MCLLAMALFVAPLLLLSGVVHAQTQDEYTVWASVVFSRTGDRTPRIIGDIPTTLTSLGANQALNAGTFFRDRYVSSVGFDNAAPIVGLSSDTIDNMQLYVLALDTQYTVASAQAFLQGMYPPSELNETTVHLIDPTAITNGTYVPSPLNGYKYAQIHTASSEEPLYPYVGGNQDCAGFDAAAAAYYNSPDFLQTQNKSKAIYDAVGPPLLSDVLSANEWDYINAYAIYDYLNYLNLHNTSVAHRLTEPDLIDSHTNTSYLDMLKWYSDQQQYAQLSNLSAVNTYTTATSPWTSEGLSGSISTIAGSLLAAMMLEQLQTAVLTNGQYAKLSLLFGDFDPLVSLFALTRLPILNSNFYGLPDYGSSFVFELFSYQSNVTQTFPSSSELWVRAYFRNGSDSSQESVNGDYLAYPLFGNGPSQTDMTWIDFQQGMSGILLEDLGDWCLQCGSSSIFCAAWNSSDTFSSSRGSTTNLSKSKNLSPAISGVIGAVVALAVAALLFAATMLIGGVRLHRVETARKSDLGGFKGSQKLASDKDLTIPKSGVVIGASVERSPISPIGNERVGSWELKKTQTENEEPHSLSLPQSRSSRPSFEITEDPFRDAVQPSERV